MRQSIALGCGLLLSLPLPLLANDSFNSEMSHVIGGMAMGGGVAALSDHYWPTRDPFWVGFGTTATVSLLAEGVQYSVDGSFSLLDAGATALGGLMGAWFTDGLMLAPELRNEAGKRYSYLGVRLSYRF